MAGGKNLVVFLAVVLVHQSTSAAYSYSFSFQFGGNACKEDVCGKGKCVPSNSSTFGFECLCEQGWKQARLRDDDSLNFMPCVIPNCTLNYNCAKTPSAPPDNSKRDNSSIFDPCFWTDCGGGSCNKESAFTHSCRCQEGYFNLFNSTSFPCFKDCSLGGDCGVLGINIANNTLTPPSQQRPGSGDDDSSGHAAILGRREGFVAMAAAAATLALFGKHV